MNLCDPSVIKSLMDGAGFDKSLGQNFLISERALEKTVEAAAPDGAGILEIGAGIGTLTCALAKRAAAVCSIEIDRTLFPILEKTTAEHKNVVLLRADFMKTDPAALAREHLAGLPCAVCANLPYYITTPAIGLLAKCGIFRRMTFMVQKEAARRICAQAGTAQYCAFTAWLSCFYDASVLFDVPAGSFLPPPKVDSSVIVLTQKHAPAADADMLERIINAAFAQRRKKLVNSVSGALGINRENLTEVFFKCGIDPARRGETLCADEFAVLARAICEI